MKYQPSQPHSILIQQINRLIRRDPAHRGLIRSESEHPPLLPDDLHTAARSLAESARCVGIVTGFFVPDADTPAPESDGPLGALLLAQALEAVGVQTWLLSDEHCTPALEFLARIDGFPVNQVLALRTSSDDWATKFWQSAPGSQLTHLLAVERVGPSHTPESLHRQIRSGPVPLADFERLVPVESQNHNLNMRGFIIDAQTAPLHRLFETAAEFRPQLQSIGIGDGGNEIGMGRIPWEELARRNPGFPQIPCRIAADHTILAGTSNWGAAALAAATLLLKNQARQLARYTADHQEQLHFEAVQERRLIDGITRQPALTVDGLPFLTYIQPWQGIRELLGL